MSSGVCAACAFMQSFVNRSLESIISKLATRKKYIVFLSSLSEQAVLRLALSETTN